MKKKLIGLLIVVLIIGAGTMAFAQGNGEGEGEGAGLFNFGQMLPFMQQMHPNLSVEQLKEMFEACHGTNGAAPSRNFQGMQPNMMGF